MCCFIVPLAQAVVTTVCRKTLKEKSLPANLPTLEKMLWGASLVLIVDHIASGELSWTFPFFTALGQGGGVELMLREMLTVGVPMSLTLTAVWFFVSLVRHKFGFQSERV